MPGQRWCLDCFAAYKRARRAAQLLTERGIVVHAPSTVSAKNGQRDGQPPGQQTGDGAPAGAIAPPWIYEPPEPFVPFRDVPGRGGWAVEFLADFSVHGGRALAASRAGVTTKTVERLLATDPAFAEEVERAHEYHRDLLEWESLNLGRRRHNPLPFFDRLKAELPARHVERLQIARVTLNIDAPLWEDPRGLLLNLLRTMSPETRSECLKRPEMLTLLDDAEYRAAFFGEPLALPAAPIEGPHTIHDPEIAPTP